MITLTTPYQVSVNGVSEENDTTAACSSYGMDFESKMLTVVFKQGTLGGNPLNVIPGPLAPVLTVVVYLGPTQNGLTQYQWWKNGVLQGGVVPSATITPFVTQLLGDRNTSEGFVAVAGGLLPGTITAWTTI